MPTGPFSTEVAPFAWTRAVADTGHLLAFRLRTRDRRRKAAIASGVLMGLTVSVALVPAFVDGAGGEGRARDVLILLSTMLSGFLVLALISAIAAGGGRELMPREHAAAFPVSPTTDHLGALLLAPLNLAWLVQSWLLLGATAYAIGPQGLLGSQVVTLVWIAAATAAAQALAWCTEWVRRHRNGILAVRAAVAAVAVGFVWLQFTGGVVETLDRLPSVRMPVGMVAAREGEYLDWARVVTGELIILVLAVILGAVPAHLAARKTPHEESRAESQGHEARAMPGSDLAMLVRVDRSSVWRSVPMRRGLTVLAIGPGLVALAGNLDWASVAILPGLVTSGGVLLFGVNAWCLDGRGVLWRESLPVDPRAVFDARTLVLAEWLGLAAGLTILLASLRAGVPTLAELTAVVCTWLVVTVQVVAVGLSWSGRRPYSVDMRSARATPAPPVVMVGYSARLALSTTLTALVFSVLARAPYWWSPLVAVPFLAWSLLRLVRARSRWTHAQQRAGVVMTVAA